MYSKSLYAMNEARWITDREEWQKQIDAIGGYDFYNLPDFIFQEAELLGGRPVAFVYGETLIPLTLRDIPGQEGKWQDALSPYGYPGILCSDERLLDDTLTAFQQFARAEKVVATFLRLHPIHNQMLIPERAGLRQSLRGKTHSIYLPEGIEAIRGNYSSNHRRNIKKLRKQGYEARFDAWEYLSEWQQIYVATMDRLEATDYYKFDLAYFEHLRSRLNCRLLTVHHPDGSVACGGIFTYYADVIQYHLGGTAESELGAAPSKLMFDTAIADAVENGGYQWLHLGGGVGARDDSLARFKKGFGNREHWFRTLEMVHHKDVYDSLSQGKEDTGFFPLYRKG